jgi:hypothetical protein
MFGAAKECFCGCGRHISRFPLGNRSINGRGRYVTERLEWVRAIAPDEPEFPEWCQHGEEIVRKLRAAMHGEIDPRTLDEREVRHWQAYGRNIERVAGTMGYPPINVWLKTRECGGD